jgi:hypothetical protein
MRTGAIILRITVLDSRVPHRPMVENRRAVECAAAAPGDAVTSVPRSSFGWGAAGAQPARPTATNAIKLRRSRLRSSSCIGHAQLHATSERASPYPPLPGRLDQ